MPTEHSPAGSRIEFSATSRGEQSRSRLPIAAAGIDPKVRDHLFERFAHDGEGIGLGLAISKALAEVQQGTISLADRPGGGTVATVSLPAAL